MPKTATACPICRKPARRAKATTGNFLDVTCTECGQFLASESFRQMAPKLPTAVRRNALEKARMRAGYGASPSVTTYDLP
jgi:hypothetical protein